VGGPSSPSIRHFSSRKDQGGRPERGKSIGDLKLDPEYTNSLLFTRSQEEGGDFHRGRGGKKKNSPENRIKGDRRMTRNFRRKWPWLGSRSEKGKIKNQGTSQLERGAWQEGAQVLPKDPPCTKEVGKRKNRRRQSDRRIAEE